MRGVARHRRWLQRGTALEMVTAMVFMSAAFALTERAHEADELSKLQLSITAEIVQDHFDQPRSDGILVELRHATEIVGVQIAFVSFRIARTVPIELVETRPQRGDLLLRQTYAHQLKSCALRAIEPSPVLLLISSTSTVSGMEGVAPIRLFLRLPQTRARR